MVVDDHEVMRRGICGLLMAQPDFDVVCQVSTGTEAVRKTEQYQPDVVLLDLSIPEPNGFQAAPMIKKVAPNTEILIVTQYDNLFFAREAFAVGARGFVTKTRISQELIVAVREVYSKKNFVSQSMKDAVFGTAAEDPTASRPSLSSAKTF